MLIFFILFSAMFVVNIVVISKLKSKYPKVLDKAGSPSGLLSNTTNASFTYGFIGLRLYRHENLDSNTMNWCNLLFIIAWLFLINFAWFSYSMIEARL